MDLRAFGTDLDTTTGVATVTLVGTGAGGAMGGLVWTELPVLAAGLDGDERVRAVVLRGCGEDFSVGLDLRWYLPHHRRMARRPDGLSAALLAETTAMQAAIGAVAASRLPWVAAVHGACVGAGLDLVAACDIRLASADAYFSLREVVLGIVADLGGLQRLPRVIGAGATLELALTGRDLPAAEALALGLVTRVAADRAAVVADATGVAERIAGHPPTAVSGIKAVLDRTTDLPLAEGLRHVALWNAAFLPSVPLTDLLAAALRGDGDPTQEDR